MSLRDDAYIADLKRRLEANRNPDGIRFRWSDGDIEHLLAKLEAAPHGAQPSSPLSPEECDGMIEQFCRDLNAAHDEIVRLQGGDPAQFDWPEWSAPANSIRWAEKRLGRPLSKTSLRAAAAGGAQPSAAPSEKPPAWSPLERFLLDRQAETRDPRYQDAAVSLYQQRTGWGAPEWPVRVPSAASREIQALREALQRWVDIDNAPDQIAAYLSVLADTKALLSSPANPPDIPDGSSE